MYKPPMNPGEFTAFETPLELNGKEFTLVYCIEVIKWPWFQFKVRGTPVDGGAEETFVVSYDLFTLSAHASALVREKPRLRLAS